MARRPQVPWSETTRQLEHIPVLAEFAKPFPNLLGTKKAALGESFGRVAEALSKSKRTGAIQFTITDGSKTRHWCVSMTPTGCSASEASTELPDLEILADAKSWADVAAGRVSLLEAFTLGKVRVRGSIELARVLARRIHS